MKPMIGKSINRSMTIDANWSIDIDNRWTIDAQVFSDYRFHRLPIFVDCRCQSISFEVRFRCWFLKPCNCIQTIRWTNSNLEHLCVLRVRIRTCWNVWDTNIFLTPIEDNRWVATTFVWLSIGHRLAHANRYQLIIPVLSTPRKRYVRLNLHQTWKLFQLTSNYINLNVNSSKLPSTHYSS